MDWMTDLKDLEKPSKLDELSGFKLQLYMHIIGHADNKTAIMNHTSLWIAKQGKENKTITKLKKQHDFFREPLNKDFFDGDKITEAGTKYFERMYENALRVERHNLDTTSFKAICDKFNDKTPAYINKELSILIKQGFISKKTIEGNFKEVYYYASLPDVEFVRSYFAFMKSFDIKKKIKIRYTTNDLRRIESIFRTNTREFFNLNVTSIKEFYQQVLAPTIAGDNSHIRASYLKNTGIAFSDDSHPKHMKRILKERSNYLLKGIKRVQEMHKDEKKFEEKYLGEDL